MPRIFPLVIILCALVLNALPTFGQDDFATVIRPLLKKYCLTCHSTAEQEGELDLERFAQVADVKRAPAIWQSLLEQFANNEMPPKDKPQPTAEEKAKITTWAKRMLHDIAVANAGDPGAVVLRRLSNAEYGYTLRDLTGVETLDPAAEFPVDGAAGEGFTNASAALVMSPALLQKYLDAAKDNAAHAVLAPDGIRFSAFTTPRDWTDETLTKIRQLYAQHSESGGATAVNLQGIKFDTNAGGRLAVEKYIAALLKDRDALLAKKTDLATVAKTSGLSPKYLTILWTALNDTKSSLVLDGIRARFAKASPAEAPQVIAAIQEWQQSLWRFASVGHIGKKNGPVGWQEPVTPLVAKHEMRLKLPPPADGGDITIYLAASDAGDGAEQDLAVWENVRIAVMGRPDLPLRNVRGVVQQLAKRQAAVSGTVARCLAAAAEIEAAKEPVEINAVAQKHNVEVEVLGGWLDYLGIGAAGKPSLGALIAKKMDKSSDYNFIKGWTGDEALSVLANSSDAAVRIPGQMKPHSVAAHPSPKIGVVIAWQSPITGTIRIDGSVQDAHTDCGNGVAYALEFRRGRTRERLANGVTEGDKVAKIGRLENVRVAAGDVIALVINPRDASHICDMTALDLTIHDGTKEWDLGRDISPDILAGNPHADRHGNPAVWHFVGEPVAAESPSTIPQDSLLAQWRKATDPATRQKLAEELQRLFEKGLADVPADSPNRALVNQLLALNGPLLASSLRTVTAGGDESAASPYGIDPALFGKLPSGDKLDATSLAVQAPSVIEFKLPASLVAGGELVASGRLAASGGKGSVQMQLLTQKPASAAGIAASKTEAANANGKWSDNNLRSIFSTPIIVADGSETRQRYEQAFTDFRNLFPAALCYTKIVPVDEVVTLTLFYREDAHLQRLMLSDEQSQTLDRLWQELLFVSEAPLKQVDVFDQLWQYATQDADPSAFEPLRKPTLDAAAAFKKQQLDAEPKHLQAVLDLATRAWRRPLREQEQQELRKLYAKLRTEGLKHEPAVRMVIARVFVAPAFLYRGELPKAGTPAAAVNDWELATRLSYFLWSSTPDAELRALAAAGTLHQDEVLLAQTRRMLKDPKVRRLAVEFGCQYLHVRDVETLDEKSERHFPTFLSLRAAMQEEATRFFVDQFQNDRSILALLDADYSFVNGPLAKHYGLTVAGEDWQRVEGLRAKGRGGVLGFASTLAKQSGASRTSPILRGNWVSEFLLGDKLPRPPKGVPLLPEEPPAGLSERQLIERHSIDPKCVTCHKRIDPLGFALEGFDAIGRSRDKDVAGMPIDTKVKLLDDSAFDGLDGLRTYILTTRREDFLRQYCRKLLGYSLGRGVQLSDQPLLDAMLVKLAASEYRTSTAIELIVLSPQFRQVRGRDFVTTHE